MQPGQQVHEHALHVHPHVVEGQAAIGAKFHHGLEQATHKVFLGHIAVAHGQQAVFQAQLAAGGLHFAHEEVTAGEQQNAGFGLGKARGHGAAPEIEAAAGFKLPAQKTVIGCVQPLIEGQGYGQQRATAVADLPAGQRGQGAFCFRCVN